MAPSPPSPPLLCLSALPAYQALSRPPTPTSAYYALQVKPPVSVLHPARTAPRGAPQRAAPSFVAFARLDFTPLWARPAAPRAPPTLALAPGKPKPMCALRALGCCSRSLVPPPAALRPPRRSAQTAPTLLATPALRARQALLAWLDHARRASPAAFSPTRSPPTARCAPATHSTTPLAPPTGSSALRAAPTLWLPLAAAPATPPAARARTLRLAAAEAVCLVVTPPSPTAAAASALRPMPSFRAPSYALSFTRTRTLPLHSPSLPLNALLPGRVLQVHSAASELSIALCAFLAHGLQP